MKKIFTPILLLFSIAATAQLNNSWIDYSKTYYKFKLGSDTLCRISQSTLAAAGLGNVPAEKFKLIRNGEEVRLFTSVSSGILGAGDYIEFWGEMNDGKPDKQLYRNGDDQLNDRYSLETDTVTYFLTVNDAPNLRFTTTANNPPGTLTPEPFFMRKVDMYYRTQMNRGFAQPLNEYIYSSAYDPGEGWSSADAQTCCDLTQEFTGLNVFSGGPVDGLSLRINAFGNAPNVRNLRVKLFQNVVIDQPMNFFTARKISISNLPIALLQSTSNLPIYMNGYNGPANDRIVVASVGITYPATFNFNNQKNFYFELKASANGNYLLIDNFNSSGIPPVLYDLTSGNRVVGNLSLVPGKVAFVLPASSEPLRRFRLVSQDNANIFSINALSTRNFINYTQSQNQGDYIIISHSFLNDDGSGNNYVNAYAQYRNSIAGGSFSAKVYDIDELTDQFAFGIKKHPASIRDFVRFAAANFTTAPKFILLIGRGMSYSEFRRNESNPIASRLNLIPTFGWPASDVLLAAEPGKVTPLVPIGRIAAVNGTEVNNYLQKVIQYEQAQRLPSPSIADKAWMKNFIHVVGGKDASENESFRIYMNGYERIAEDTLYGAHVETFTKTSAGAIQQANSQRIQDLFQEGLSFIGYFGHSSANTFEFNLSNPEAYNNQGKYPFFNVSGCSAGNFYIFDALRLSGNLTLSEKYILTAQRGSIGFLADTHFGVPPFLNAYNTNFYNEFCRLNYGGTIGDQIKDVTLQLGGSNVNLDFFTRIHLEEIALHGDPAIRINYFSKPDYVIEDQLVKISPSIISVADNSFNVNIKMLNIGKAIGDSIIVNVKRKLPNNSVVTVYNQTIAAIKSVDSILLSIPINPIVDKGLNQLIVTLDYNNRVDELYETNNTLTKSFYIFEDELRPTYPYNFSIVNQPAITFYANTANPLGEVRQYTMEIDTTENFNSPAKRQFNTSGAGGVIAFIPTGFSMVDSTVYYWRVSMVPIGSASVIWNSFSFIYLANSTPGFNQSHYYQHTKSIYQNITLQSDRKYVYNQVPRELIIRTGLFPFYNFDRINVNLDFDQLEFYGCRYNSLQFYIFDSTTLLPWRNYNINSTNGLYGSFRVCATSSDTARRFFEYPYNSATYRKSAMDLLDLVPNGMYIAITNLGNKNTNTSFINEWKNDTLVLGSGNSLYHKLKQYGFTRIDSFTRNLPFLYFFRKGVSSFSPIQVMGAKDSSYIDQSINLNSTLTSGSVTTPVFGTAGRWESLHWGGRSTDPIASSDTVQVEVYGIRQDGTGQLLATVRQAQDTTLSFIDASIYPNLKLKILSSDPTYATPYQLKYIRVNGSYVPEGVVAPNLSFQAKDTVEQGEDLNITVAFKNISSVAFDSMMKVKLEVTDKNNVRHIFDVPKRKILLPGDTLLVNYSIPTANLPGKNVLFIEFNPDNDQLEQYHYNNLLYKEFFVKEDKYNPLLDVTFDGVHILNKDVVSAKPSVVIKLKDESRFLALKDTSLISVKIKYPEENVYRPVYFGDTMRFNPANLNAGNNTATIDYTPHFVEDGEYELVITGKDVAGNNAGNLEYRVTFNVINKPMISEVMNYPNPFTTSTAFVFTVTGSEVPQNIRIQILTITGKIVREITKEELGPLHIGRNITEFKWDGTDSYGQPLANGVYLYRVITNLNGQKLDKYRISGDIDKYFNKGYGKMYLMR